MRVGIGRLTILRDGKKGGGIQITLRKTHCVEPVVKLRDFSNLLHGELHLFVHIPVLISMSVSSNVEPDLYHTQIQRGDLCLRHPRDELSG